jgi:Na+/H+ antiporter
LQSILIQYVFLILIILVLMMIANKLRVAYPIVLVLGGLALSATHQFSGVTIDPELVFLIFLPPLLYEAAWQVSWKEFWRWRRVITAFAFPIVIVTACVVAFVSSSIIPGFTLALGFLLGGIVSPPDAVSATTIMRNVDVPKSLVSIAEGESLLNDASSLIVFRFAVLAVITGQFSIRDAAISSVLVIVMGIVIGLLVGLVFYAIHRWLPITTGIEVVLTLVTPYCMYYAAEHFHFSGVLAVVSGGLFLSSHRQTILTAESRIEGVSVWNSLVFVLNALVFLLIGLQLPAIAGALGDTSLAAAIGYAMVISFVLIVTRLAMTLGGSPFTTFMSNFITVADPYPGWRNPLIMGWAGMRGVVSLAMALSIPLYAAEGEPFPFRNLILFITFVVILVTLVFQGLTLPWLIRKVGPEDKFSVISDTDQELLVQRTIARASVKFLKKNHGSRIGENEHLKSLLRKYQAESELHAGGIGDEDRDRVDAFEEIYISLLEHQRSVLEQMNQSSKFDEELIRKYLRLIDFEEFRTRESKYGDSIDHPESS